MMTTNPGNLAKGKPMIEVLRELTRKVRQVMQKNHYEYIWTYVTQDMYTSKMFLCKK